MALQSTGSISLNDVNIELQRNPTAQLSMGDNDVRLLANKTSGPVSINDLFGKSYIFYATISTNIQELNLELWAKGLGWNGIFPAVITINSGAYVWSDSTSNAGLTTGIFPRGLTIVNNGFIMGRGGDGATGRTNLPGADGGPAIILNSNSLLSLYNNGYIGGGGGGGGHGLGGQGPESSYAGSGGGGGAGGGTGGASDRGDAGGIGGSIGQSGSNGGGDAREAGFGGTAGGSGGGFTVNGLGSDHRAGGGGGGRIFPGVSTAGGTGRGIGGGAGQPGGAGSTPAGAGGGGWGAAGGDGHTRGGAAGKAISISSGSVSVLSGSSTIYGAIS